MAQVNAQAKAQVNAQVIFPRTSVASEMTRKSFCLEAQVICLEAQVICLDALSYRRAYQPTLLAKA
jgi:hypothetical protein